MDRPDQHALKQRPRGINRGLVALNVGLLAVLATVAIGTGANAQNASGRARGAYAIVGGDISYGNSNAFYVLDSVNQELLALRWESRGPTGDLMIIGRRDLEGDANARVGR